MKAGFVSAQAAHHCSLKGSSEPSPLDNVFMLTEPFSADPKKARRPGPVRKYEAGA